VCDATASAPRVELPQFEGANPKLWQHRCEEYFKQWNTPSSHWVLYGSSQFTSAAATWLESFITKYSEATWPEFMAAMPTCFMHNQHQVLLRRLYRISQTGTMEDYDLIDAISAYDSQPNQLNYLTRFLDGLKPTIRVLVAIQQPADLDSAYTMALLYDELGDGGNPFTVPSSHHKAPARRQFSLSPPPPLPQPPSRWISKSVEEKKNLEGGRFGVEDKWSTLKAYRRARGLCFTCGERWGKEHQCPKTIPLYIVQELVHCMQENSDELTEEQTEEPAPILDHLCLSAVAFGSTPVSSKSLQLRVLVQGHSLLFLVDSGSSSCFIDI
jgi:hypothetical protein